ncbi:hypothetical protein FRB99_002987 [Tulasnella sp. 403]|nr:hypothetical protein FRB99_002987 [Tulasnella sp. 403]
MPFDPPQVAYFDIYPPIAIARVGDSKEWYTGPEIPGVEPLLEGGFRDAEHKIKRCAPRFRVYAFDRDNRVLGEVTNEVVNDVTYQIQWQVHVANKKSAWVRFRGQNEPRLDTQGNPVPRLTLRNPTVQPWPKDSKIDPYAYCDTRNKLIIDSGDQKIYGNNAGPVHLDGKFWGSKDHPTSVHLGDLYTDEDGRLIVAAGDGHAYSLNATTTKPQDQPFLLEKFDNADWVDSMFDGYIRASVVITDENKLPMRWNLERCARVMSAPPRYAHSFQMPSTLYDVIEEVYERQKRNQEGDGYDVGTVSFYEHIDPLFRRMYMNSWTNFRANEGHGPRKADFWLDNKRLSDPAEGNEMRQRVFNRIRLPVVKLLPEQLPNLERQYGEVHPANHDDRVNQADAYYMPRLGGNSGDMPEERGDPNSADRWASLTHLQYDRLKKWSQGQFENKTRPPVYNKFDDIPLQQQPDALAHAGIEWTVGAPLYPGIECYWVAEFGEMYDLQRQFPKFRFAENVKPGDLTRGLSLPWHADFYMCNTHWWPAIRPDDVVTEEYFEDVKLHLLPDLHDLALNLTRRVSWDAGLDARPSSDDERYGSSEMVRKWFKLGFVSTVDYGPDSVRRPIAVETERYPDFSRIVVPSNDPATPPS